MFGAAVLPEGFPVIAHDDEEGLFEERALVEAGKEPLQETVGVGERVQVPVERRLGGELALREALRQTVVVVRGQGEDGQEEGPRLTVHPGEGRLQHAVVLVAKVARLLESRRQALLAHEGLEAEVGDEAARRSNYFRRLEKAVA